MLQENLKDASVIIQNILNQPLALEGKKEEVSLFEAALKFDPNNADGSDLSLILKSFIDYPEPTHTLLRELELLSDDLNIR
ncbi:MAG TPA: hypothetical protein VJ112_02500 [Rhabdochlamydiaceae bacterium]|nr:hypothetical protein [Rhabdochlamydiaceae bacterium]